MFREKFADFIMPANEWNNYGILYSINTVQYMTHVNVRVM